MVGEPLRLPNVGIAEERIRHQLLQRRAEREILGSSWLMLTVASVVPPMLSRSDRLPMYPTLMTLLAGSSHW